MQILADGIDPAITVKILPNFKPITNLALKWQKTAAGNYYAVDRTSTSDIYEADITVSGKESAVSALIDAIEANRQTSGTTYQGSNVIQLSSFASDEKIFGEDVDHSGTINATVMSFKARKQRSWKGWSVMLRLKAIAPSFTGTASLPALQYLNIGYDADNELTINKIVSYSQAISYLDSNKDAGEFSGTFTLTVSDMQSLRRYIATQRGSDYTITNISGVDKPFGDRRDSGYPYTAKLIDWEDLGNWGVKYRRIKLKFAEVV